MAKSTSIMDIGFPSETLAFLRRHWLSFGDIGFPSETLAFLRRSRYAPHRQVELPVAAGHGRWALLSIVHPQALGFSLFRLRAA